MKNFGRALPLPEYNKRRRPLIIHFSFAYHFGGKINERYFRKNNVNRRCARNQAQQP